MDDEGRLELILRNTEECISVDRLRALLRSEKHIRHYIGLEISGLIHIAQGLSIATKIADLQRASISCMIWIADWHTWINDKLGGDLNVIQEVAHGYFEHALKACLLAAGANKDSVNFLHASEVYQNSSTYWPTVMEIAKDTNLARAKRSITVAGRQENQEVELAKLLYAPMQAADIFELKAHIAHAGMDQRKAHILAIESAESLDVNPLRDDSGKKIKPIALHHSLIMGLNQPTQANIPSGVTVSEYKASLKMSKSKPEHAILVTDSADSIRNKLEGAFCPEDSVELNPVIEWANRFILATDKGPLEIKRRTTRAATLVLSTYEELVKSYQDKAFSPSELKSGVAEKLIDILAPVRSYFTEEPYSSYLRRAQEVILNSKRTG